MKHLYVITFFSIIAGISLHAADIAEQVRHAIKHNNRERVKQLINTNNINITLIPVGSFLHFSIHYDENIAIDLIERGADVNAKDDALQTPLHIATIFNHPIVVQELLKYGASPTEKDLEGNTPSDVAKIMGNSEIMQIFTDYENAPDIKEPGTE